MWSKNALIRTNSERSECLICLNFKNTKDKIVVQSHMSSYSYKTKDQKVKNNPESVFFPTKWCLRKKKLWIKDCLSWVWLTCIFKDNAENVTQCTATSVFFIDQTAVSVFSYLLWNGILYPNQYFIKKRIKKLKEVSAQLSPQCSDNVLQMYLKECISTQIKGEVIKLQCLMVFLLSCSSF